MVLTRRIADGHGRTPLFVATVGPLRAGREVLALPPSAGTKRSEGGNTRASLGARGDDYRRCRWVSGVANEPRCCWSRSSRRARVKSAGGWRSTTPLRPGRTPASAGPTTPSTTGTARRSSARSSAHRSPPHHPPASRLVQASPSTRPTTAGSARLRSRPLAAAERIGTGRLVLAARIRRIQPIAFVARTDRAMVHAEKYCDAGVPPRGSPVGAAMW